MEVVVTGGVLLTGELLLVVVVAELLTGVAELLLAVAAFDVEPEVEGVAEELPAAVTVVVVPFPLIANNFTVKIKSELGGMMGGIPEAP